MNLKFADVVVLAMMVGQILPGEHEVCWCCGIGCDGGADTTR